MTMREHLWRCKTTDTTNSGRDENQYSQAQNWILPFLFDRDGHKSSRGRPKRDFSWCLVPEMSRSRAPKTRALSKDDFTPPTLTRFFMKKSNLRFRCRFAWFVPPTWPRKNTSQKYWNHFKKVDVKVVKNHAKKCVKIRSCLYSHVFINVFLTTNLSEFEYPE